MFNLFNKIQSISLQDIADKINDRNIALIDVRSSTEYQSGHARGARSHPLETISTITEQLKNFQEVYVICQSGGRSSRAVSLLRAAGIPAINISGGTLAWRAAGLPME